MSIGYEFSSPEEIAGIKGGTVTDVWDSSITPNKTTIAIHIETPGGGSHTLMFDEEGPWHYDEAVTCQKCLTSNDTDSVYCKRCGDKLPTHPDQYQAEV